MVNRNSVETCLRELEHEGFPIFVFRLPNVFGKWSSPKYNSVVATFWHNIAHYIPIRVDEENKNVSLVYIDDVVNTFLMLLDRDNVTISHNGFAEVLPVYTVTIGELAKTLYEFKENRKKLYISDVCNGFKRAYIRHLSVIYQLTIFNILFLVTRMNVAGSLK